MHGTNILYRSWPFLAKLSHAWTCLMGNLFYATAKNCNSCSFHGFSSKFQINGFVLWSSVRCICSNDDYTGLS